MLDKLKEDYERQLRERWTPDGKRVKHDQVGTNWKLGDPVDFQKMAADEVEAVKHVIERRISAIKDFRRGGLFVRGGVIFAILFTLILSASTFASTFASQINVTGRVSPAQKLFTYPQMYVRLYNVDTGAMRAVRTNLWGEYRFEAVNPTYTYTVSPYYRKALAFDPMSYTVRPYDNVSELNFWWSE